MKTKILSFLLANIFVCTAYIAQAQGGTLSLNSSANGNISTIGQTDFWTVTVTQSGKLSFTLTDFSPSDFYAQLYAANGTTVLSSQIEAWSGTGYTATTSVDGLAAGTYKIKVFPYNTSTGAYTISNVFLAPSQGTDAEPNDYANQALTLSLNSKTGGQLGYNNYNGYHDAFDWYKVTTNANGRLQITLNSNVGTNNAVTLDFYGILYANDTTTQLGSQAEAWSGTSNTGTINVDGLAAGTYYIKLFPYNTSFGTYTIADTLFTPSQASDVEPNNYAAQAKILPLNSSKGGQLGYNNYFGYHDAADWYKVTTTSDGDLRITMNTNIGTGSNVADFYFAVYNKDSVTQRGGTTESWSATGNTGTLSIDGLAAGTYYIKIFPYSNTFGTYTIADSLFTYPNDPEPNNQPYQSSIIPSNGSVGGHIDFVGDSTLSADNTDWWKINYTGTGNISLTFTQLPYISNSNGYGDAYFIVYTDTTKSPVSTIELYSGNKTQTVNLTGVAKGYFWIKVYPYSTSFSNYTISNSYTETAAGVALTAADTAVDCSSTNSLSYKFTKLDGPYTVQLYRFGTAYGAAKNVTAKKVTFSSLPDGSYYATASVAGASIVGKSLTKGLMPMPTGTSTSNIANTQVKANWAVLSCAKYYSVEYRADTSATWIVKKTAGNVGSLLIKGLAAGTNYFWRVAAADTANKLTALSAYTDSLPFITTGTPQVLMSEADNSIENKEAGINIYPNPASSQLHIQLGNTPGSTAAGTVLMLKDMSGKTMWSNENANGSAVTVDVSRMPAGMYFLQIIQGSSSTTRKVIIVK